MDIVEVKDQYKLAKSGDINAMLGFISNMDEEGCIHPDHFVRLSFLVKLAERDNTQAYSELLAPMKLDVTTSPISIEPGYLKKEAERLSKEEMAKRASQVVNDIIQ